MRYLKNRSAILVTTKQPYRDWLGQIRIIEGWPHEPDEPEEPIEPSLFLIEEMAAENHLPQLLALHWHEIAGYELYDGTSDRSLWPDLEFEAFELWFDIQLVGAVMDLSATWIRRGTF